MNGINTALLKIAYSENEPMNKHTTFRIGGPADLFVCPTNTEQLKRVFGLDCDKFVIGNGSNLLFSDDGYRGAVVKYSDCSVEVSENEIICGAGALMSKIASVAYENSLAGFEFASGIPGTIGGGVRMNAGAYGSSLDSVVYETEYLDANDGTIKTISGKEHCFDYRHSVFCEDAKKIITKVRIKLKRGEKSEIKALTDDYTNRRRTKQPLCYPSAGSVFKRPEGYFAGALIEQSGLKGFSVGGAQVSELHAGFIINTGGASADDVKKLIEHIQNTVYKNFGLMLECEICIL